MNDIFKQLDINKIPGVADFGRVEIPASQRVQAYLAGLLGGEWASANVISWALPTGGIVHVALSPVTRAMRLVMERNGNLFQAIPLEQDDEPEDVLFPPKIEHAWQIQDKQECLSQILPALIEASNIVMASAGVTQKNKKRLRYQLGHAAKHLSQHFEQMQNREKGRSA